MLCLIVCFFFFKQKTAYEMRISDWSSDVCSSDLGELPQHRRPTQRAARQQHEEGGMAHHRPADPDPARKQAAGKDGEIPGRDREGARSWRGQPAEQIEAGWTDIEFAQRQKGKDAKNGRASCRERVCQYAENQVAAGSL